MANVLFCANQIFTTKAANFGSRRLFVISDNDDPHQNDKTAKSAAAVRAKDLFDLGVVIELFPITRNDGKFDIGKFYDVWSCDRPYRHLRLTCIGHHLP
jgi:ATP-dependent DNA helicase 2 subunit 1